MSVEKTSPLSEQQYQMRIHKLEQNEFSSFMGKPHRSHRRGPIVNLFRDTSNEMISERLCAKTRFLLILQIHCMINVHTRIYARMCTFLSSYDYANFARAVPEQNACYTHCIQSRVKCSGFLKICIYIYNKIYYNFVRGGKNKQIRTYRIKPTCVSIIQSLKWRRRGWMQL